MISKELLSEIENVGVNVFEVEHIGNNILYEWILPENNKVQKDKINVYELAHKCKEYVRIHSKFDIGSMIGEAWIFESDILYKEFTAPTEVEAIFKACEWVYNEIKQKNK